MGRKLKQLLALELLGQTEVWTWGWLGKEKKIPCEQSGAVSS